MNEVKANSDPKSKKSPSSIEKSENVEEPKMTYRGPQLDNKAMLKIVDLGNGCWKHHHFSTQI
jgi:hypothetical protein